MSCHRGKLMWIVLALTLWLTACGGDSGEPTADPQRTVEAILTETANAQKTDADVATRVAATLAARAPTTIAPTATVLAIAPTQPPTLLTDTPEVVPTQPPAPPTDTPEPATEPTATRFVLEISESAVDGDDGNDFVRGRSNTNQGRVILLPGFAQREIVAPMVFVDRIVFQVEVFDTRVGEYDGAGIDKVAFSIEPHDDSGHVLFESTSQQPPYCVFGAGQPVCAELRVDQSGQWFPGPSGGVISNIEYLARIDIVPEEGEATQWRWVFQVASPALADQTSQYTARIVGISVQDGVYHVAFETVGFEPLFQQGKLHAHFFFDTVPQEQAGAPGQGPWKLYPSAPGGPNASPFTDYTVADRPAGAEKICILVANYDHGVHLGSGNCAYLP